MRGKVIVREDEDIRQTLNRLRRQIYADRALDKWPVWAGHYAKPSEKRHRKVWLRKMKLKWRRVRAERHGKQLAKDRHAQSYARLQKSEAKVDVPAIYPGDDYAGGVVKEMLKGRRCSVRLNDGRVVGGHIPIFSTKYNEPYYPEPGHLVTVFMKMYPDLGGEFLLVGFPQLRRRSEFAE